MKLLCNLKGSISRTSRLQNLAFKTPASVRRRAASVSPTKPSSTHAWCHPINIELPSFILLPSQRGNRYDRASADRSKSVSSARAHQFSSATSAIDTRSDDLLIAPSSKRRQQNYRQGIKYCLRFGLRKSILMAFHSDEPARQAHQDGVL